MIKLSRVAVSALFAFGLAGALAGMSTPASAAPGQVCYFGECRTSTGPSAQAAPAPAPAPTLASTQSKLIARRGSWSAVMVGEGAMIIDEFANGSKFAIVAYPEGKFGLMLMHPEWRLKAGQRAEMSVTIDGETYKGTAVANDKGILEVDGCSKEMLQKLYRGRQGRIEVGDYSFTMTNLTDAKSVIDAVLAHLKMASR